mmetsp:Transcript_80431/g.173883  ORF Transcript_80431/g.173883 Transcript_80431/m.173883 type:complete len:237 (+) Transcript_80431:629-1339(+)
MHQKVLQSIPSELKSKLHNLDMDSVKCALNEDNIDFIINHIDNKYDNLPISNNTNNQADKTLGNITPLSMTKDEQNKLNAQIKSKNTLSDQKNELITAIKKLKAQGLDKNDLTYLKTQGIGKIVNSVNSLQKSADLKDNKVNACAEEINKVKSDIKIPSDKLEKLSQLNKKEMSQLISQYPNLKYFKFSKVEPVRKILETKGLSIEDVKGIKLNELKKVGQLISVKNRNTVCKLNS